MSGSAVIMPAYDPDARYAQYVKQLISQGFSRIIIVEDCGASENECLKELSCLPECDVLLPGEPYGKGLSLKRGLRHYLDAEYDKCYPGVVLTNGEAVQPPEDLVSLAKHLEESDGKSLILGERRLTDEVPHSTKRGARITKGFLKFLYTLKCDDPLTEIRAVPNAFVDEFTELKGKKFEYEMSILMRCGKKQYKVEKEPITFSFCENGKSSTRFRGFADTARIYWRLFQNFLKFSASSLTTTLIDMILFQVFLIFLKPSADNYILLSTVLARICSSMVNFLINRFIVFKSTEPILSTLLRFYCIVIPQMFASAGLVTLLYRLLPFNELIFKMIVDTTLFFVVYRFQKFFVFRRRLPAENRR